MAEGLMKHKLPKELKKRVTVQSAGILNLVGNHATEFAVKAALECGANIAKHHSQGLSRELMESSDIVLVMDESHLRYISDYFPGFKENVFLLKEFACDGALPQKKNIEDPIGSDYDFYAFNCHEINTELDRILPTLVKLIHQKLESNN